MNSEAAKYMALVLELPGLMLALYFALDYFDGAQQRLGGYGGLIGLVTGIVVWVFHIMYFMKKSEND
jgi:hypothetical protein